jgi:hypothetical protein
MPVHEGSLDRMIPYQSIVAFGDSWIWGSDINDENAFMRESLCMVGQVGMKLGLPVVNRGVAGSSQRRTIIEFERWYKECPDPKQQLVIVGLTEPGRETFVNNGQEFWWDRYVETAHELEGVWEELKKTWLTYCDDHAARQQNHWINVHWFANMCKQNQIPFMLINIFPNQSNFDMDCFMRGNLMDLLPEDLRNPQTYHPTVEGCDYLSTLIIKELEAKSLI